jgi:hypothetical protein
MMSKEQTKRPKYYSPRKADGGMHILLIGPISLTKQFGAALLKAADRSDDDDDDGGGDNFIDVAQMNHDNRSIVDQVDAQAIQALERNMRLRPQERRQHFRRVHVYMKESLERSNHDQEDCSQNNSNYYNHIILVTSSSSKEFTKDRIYRQMAIQDWIRSLRSRKDILGQCATIVVSIGSTDPPFNNAAIESAAEDDTPSNETDEMMQQEEPIHVATPNTTLQQRQFIQYQDQCIPVFCWDNNNNAGVESSLQSAARLVWKSCLVCNRGRYPACSPLLTLSTRQLLLPQGQNNKRKQQNR